MTQSKPNPLRLTATIRPNSDKALDLASELELDRSNTVVGGVWTKGDMLHFLSNPLNRIYAWSEVTPEEPADDFEASKYLPRPFRVVVGITYEPVDDPDSSKIKFSHKHISHMVVDATKGLDFAYNAVFDVLDLLAMPTKVGEWCPDGEDTVLSCALDSRDIKWHDVVDIAGFRKVSELEVNDSTFFYYERRD